MGAWHGHPEPNHQAMLHATSTAAEVLLCQHPLHETLWQLSFRNDNHVPSNLRSTSIYHVLTLLQAFAVLAVECLKP